MSMLVTVAGVAGAGVAAWLALRRAPGLVPLALLLAWIAVQGLAAAASPAPAGFPNPAVAWAVTAVLGLASVAGAVRRRSAPQADAPPAAQDPESWYRDLVRHALYGIYRSTLEGRFLDVNDALVRMLGYDTREEVLALELERDVYVQPQDRRHLVERYQQAGRVEGLEVPWRRADGSRFTVRLSGRPVLGADGGFAGFEMIAEDVTDRRALEEQLRHAQKMEAVARLTAGLAHDFNNILTVIRTNAELIALALPPEHQALSAELDDLVAASQRGATLIKKLMAYSRRDIVRAQPVDLGRAVADVGAVLRRLLPPAVEIRTAADAVPSASADVGAVEQMLFNLATNAWDAMPEGGVLSIRVYRTELDEEFCRRHPWCAPGVFVAIAVTDTGAGMDETVRDRLFEPFFTTKRPGQGTGLGMAMVHGLMERHRGHVGVVSAPGRGTTVTLLFPAAGAPAPPPAAAADHAVLGTGTVLLVDDEAALRRAAQRILERHGYAVVAAADGAAGLAELRARRDRVDVVLTDLVMPSMSGLELFGAARREGIAARFVFMTGYAPDEVRGAAGIPAESGLLGKPWSIPDLLRHVREAAARNAPGG